ncbi:MAG TPA: S8 family peptidase [Candidatus Limnocylindrales bacterium]|jgi:serine protease AprX|nr:S8 family peptidase [Candidatus Limnocylindrales bacterium]
MRRRSSCFGVLAVLAALLAGAGPAAAAAPRAGATHIVQFMPGVSQADGARLVRAAGGRPLAAVSLIGGLAARLTAPEAARLAHAPGVRAVSANRRVAPQADRFDTSSLGTVYPTSVLAPDVWATATGRGVGVAVIDTGIDGAHPDFRGDDGASRVTASVVVSPDATTPGDGYGHGTHVAGIIAGDSGRRGAGDPLAGRYVGIAPDANLISVKISDDDGNATVLDAIYGLQFAVDHKSDLGIRVVNLSLSSTVAESARTDPLDAAVEAAWFNGLVVVAAAGNRGSDEDAVRYAPANDPYVITVGAAEDQGTAARADDTVTAWSSRGTTQDGVAKPEVTAPGSQIVSTLAGGSDYTSLCPGCVVDGDYIRAGGTSQAAPVVSGIAALLLQAHPNWTPDQVKYAVSQSGRVFGSSIAEVSALGAFLQYSGQRANKGLTPNELLDPTTGAIDYTRSSWSRSSWSAATGDLTASWARSSWSCVCWDSPDDPVDPTRSSWSRSSWSRSSWSTRWDY